MRSEKYCVYYTFVLNAVVLGAPAQDIALKICYCTTITPCRAQEIGQSGKEYRKWLRVTKNTGIYLPFTQSPTQFKTLKCRIALRLAKLQSPKKTIKAAESVIVWVDQSLVLFTRRCNNYRDLTQCLVRIDFMWNCIFKCVIKCRLSA